MSQPEADFVFAPLGGLGEIGMNAALYGYGPPRARKWILVDCGLGFPGPDLPGVEIVLPDLSAVEKLGRDLLAIVITHAHEDHIGAIAASAFRDLSSLASISCCPTFRRWKSSGGIFSPS